MEKNIFSYSFIERNIYSYSFNERNIYSFLFKVGEINFIQRSNRVKKSSNAHLHPAVEKQRFGTINSKI